MGEYDLQTLENGLVVAKHEEGIDLYIEESLGKVIEVWVGDPLMHFVGEIVDFNAHQVSLLGDKGVVFVIRRHHIVVAMYGAGEYPRPFKGDEED